MRAGLLGMVVLFCAPWSGPASAATWQDALGQARQLRLASRPAEAADLLETALRNSPRDESLLGLYALCLLDAGRGAEAAELAARVGDYDGGDVRLHTALGRVLRMQGDAAGAAHAFRLALKIKPAAVEASVELVAVHLGELKFGAALAVAEKLEAHVPDMGRQLAARALVAHARRHQMVGAESLGAAITKFREALDKTPEDQAIVRQLIECLLTSIRVDEARELVDSKFSATSQRVERLYYRARCLDALTDVVGARAAYGEALGVDPGHAPTLLELAKLDLDDGEHAAAKARLALLPKEIDTARRNLLAGLAELGLGDFVRAEAGLRRALELEPDNTKAAYHLGRLLVRLGRTDDGQSLLGQVTRAQR
jgi:thioredoxin-like negative regulator of GroEL